MAPGYSAQSTDRRALALLLHRGLVSWDGDMLRVHPSLHGVDASQMRPPVWGRAHDEQLRALLSDGVSPGAIAQRLGFPLLFVRTRITHLRRLTPQRQLPSPAQRVAALRANWSYVNAAAALGMNAGHLMRWAKTHGVRLGKRRPRGIRKPLPSNYERYRAIITAVDAGASLSTVGTQYGLTRQRIEQIVTTYRQVLMQSSSAQRTPRAAAQVAAAHRARSKA